MGQTQKKEIKKCPMGVHNGTNSVERKSEMSNGSVQWDKLSGKRSRNVQWECSTGQDQKKERVKCPMGVFNGTNSVERESEMSNGSAQQDKIRRKRSRNVQWECSMGQTQWKERVKCPMGVLNRTRSEERDQEMSNGSVQWDKLSGKRE